MARPYRLQAENTLYHIMCRGNQKQKIFYCDSDYLKYIKHLGHTIERYGFYLYAYALMPNHIHLLLETPQPNISKIMHSLNTAYASYITVKHKKSGHLFKGRYKSIIVDKDNYLLELTAYIHLNPVRAGLVKKPEDYAWSSYVDYIKRSKNSNVCWENLKKYVNYAPKEYAIYVQSRVNEKLKYDKKLYAGFILGSTKFIKETLADLKLQVESPDIAFADYLNDSYTVKEVVEHIANYYKIKTEDIYQSTYKSSIKKKIALYVIRRVCPSSNREVGKYFGLTDTAVIKAKRWIEKEIEVNRKLNKEIKILISAFRG